LEEGAPRGGPTCAVDSDDSTWPLLCGDEGVYFESAMRARSIRARDRSRHVREHARPQEDLPMRPRFPETVRRRRSITLVATQAWVTRIIIDATTSVTDPSLVRAVGGRGFGELDPKNPLALDANGRAEYIAPQADGHDAGQRQDVARRPEPNWRREI